MASMLSAATSAPAAQKNSVAPFVGLKSTSSLPISRKPSGDLTSKIPKGGSSIKCCIQVWPPEGKKKFETLSYLPTLSNEELIKEVEYLIRKGWVPCIEFSKEGFVYRENHSSPGYYDGRYWTMWKLPMFGCTDAVQVVKEVEECKKAYPDYFNRIIGFDNKRQVQCVSFISYKPPSFEG